jgi:hypothetical protein
MAGLFYLLERGNSNKNSTPLLRIRNQQQELQGSSNQEKVTVTIAGHFLIGFLSVVSQYAAVDTLALLPAFILCNSIFFLSTLAELNFY